MLCYYTGTIVVYCLQTNTDLVTNLQVKITSFGVKPQINSFTIVTNDVFGPWVLIGSPPNKFLHSM